MTQPPVSRPPASQPPAGNSPAKRLFLVLFIAVTLAVAGFSVWTNLTRWKENDIAHARAPASANTLVIDSGGRQHRFQIELANDDAKRAQGLMFRREMAQDAGMLFDFGGDIPVSMWMKNTYLSLDMLFIRKDGVIHRIEHRTEPMSEKTISSGGNVRAVLEINGGLSEKLGLKAGDKVLHPMFPAK